MDIQKIHVRRDIERMVINYFLMGKISKEQSNRIINYVDDVIGGGCFPKPEQRGKIIHFPAPAGTRAPDHAERPATEADPMPPYPEYCDTFRKYGFDNFKYFHHRIFATLYDLRIRSLEELAKTPPEKIRRRGIGPKTYEIIRSVLKSNGIASEAWGIPEAAVTRQEN